MLWENLRPQDRNELLQRGQIRELVRRSHDDVDTLWLGEAICVVLSIVLSGAVALCQDLPTDTTAITRIVRPTQVACISGLKEDAHTYLRPLTERSRVLVVAVEAIGDLGRVSQQLYHQEIAQIMAGMLHEARRLHMRAEQRLAAALVEFADVTSEDGRWAMVDQTTISQRVGMRREAMRPLLNVWVEDDIISTRYRKVKILNREALIKIAGEALWQPA